MKLMKYPPMVKPLYLSLTTQFHTMCALSDNITYNVMTTGQEPSILELWYDKMIHINLVRKHESAHKHIQNEQMS